jgi:hypothetical protein
MQSARERERESIEGRKRNRDKSARSRVLVALKKGRARESNWHVRNTAWDGSNIRGYGTGTT